MSRRFLALATLLTLILGLSASPPARAQSDPLQGLLNTFGVCVAPGVCWGNGSTSQRAPAPPLPPGGQGPPPPGFPSLPGGTAAPGPYGGAGGAPGRPIQQSVPIPCGRGRTPGAGLFVGGQQITGEPAELQPVLRGSLIGVQSTPRQILKAMICSPSRRFSFATMQALATNIKIRDGVLTSMRRVMSGQIPLTFARSLEDLQMPAGKWKKSTTNPYGGIVITTVRGGVPINQESWTWESLPPLDAHQAIESILTQPSTLECLTGVQVIVLLGVEQAIGAADFDAMHPRRGPGGSALWGIGVPLLFHGDPSVITPRISSARSHLILVRYRTLDQGAPHAAPVDTDNDPRTGPIAQADMVPGDYVYVNSISDYDVVHQGGSWNGENAVYMGPDSFYGLGLGTSFQTESELKSDIANHYNTDQFVNKGWFWRPADPSEILWTLIASPTLNGNPAEAGPFVR